MPYAVAITVGMRHRGTQALAELRVEGVRSTASLHRRLLANPELRAGPVHTRWLEGLPG